MKEIYNKFPLLSKPEKQDTEKVNEYVALCNEIDTTKLSLQKLEHIKYGYEDGLDKFVWKSQTGYIAISSMEDSHLVNTIAMLYRSNHHIPQGLIDEFYSRDITDTKLLEKGKQALLGGGRYTDMYDDIPF